MGLFRLIGYLCTPNFIFVLILFICFPSKYYNLETINESCTWILRNDLLLVVVCFTTYLYYKIATEIHWLSPVRYKDRIMIHILQIILNRHYMFRILPITNFTFLTKICFWSHFVSHLLKITNGLVAVFPAFIRP